MSKNARTSLISQRTRPENQKLETKEEFRLPNQEEDTLADQLELEIGCPRCSNIMELLSKFNYLSYFCGSCHLELSIV
jgi:hypothetical protein